jgi:chromosome segregation ATPase
MWIWWVISLVVLIACFIFAYRMIISSYKFLPGDKNKLYGFKKSTENNDIKTGEIINLKSKLQKMEENSSFYEIQFSKLVQRLKVLEEAQNQSSEKIATEKKDEEDWKELYYEENEQKENLENDLDEIKQKLEEAENKLNTIEDNNSKWSELKSDYDARLNDLHSMQDHLGLLQRQLEAAADREKELEQSLESAVQTENKYIRLQNEHIRLQSENEELRRQIIEMNNREKDMETNLARLHELESKLALYEEEKAKMIAILKHQ